MAIEKLTKAKLSSNDLILKSVCEIIGLTNKDNDSRTVQPVFHYIKDVLKKYNINPIEAKERINDYKGAFSPNWNKNVIPFIIEYLNEITKQPTKLVNVAYQNEVTNRFNIEIEKHHTRHKKTKHKFFDVNLKNEFTKYQMYLRDVLNTEITFEIIDNNTTAEGIEGFYNHNTSKKLDALKQIEKIELIGKIEDLKFISSTNEFTKTFDGFVIISKNGTDKQFTAENYFNLLLENYNNEIEKSETHENKLLIISNGILHFNKCMLQFANQPNIKLFIKEGIEYLENYKRNVITLKTSAIEPTPKVNEIKEPSLKQIALYHVYLESDINQNNANDYLKDFKHSSGHKLRLEFNKYRNSLNRINEGTDSVGFRIKLFEAVILMLKETNNTDAILKAENEFIQFKKKIE